MPGRAPSWSTTSWARSIRDAIIGQSDSATKAEIATDIASVTPNSRKSWPLCPGRNESGRKTAASVVVVAITAKNTCSVPSTAAARGPSPWARRRTMFSRTTMASSTTSPVASTSASSVRMLTEYPVA